MIINTNLRKLYLLFTKRKVQYGAIGFIVADSSHFKGG